MLLWTQSYSTGRDDLDNQHKTLFTFINELEGSLGEGRGVRWFEINFRFLETYAQAHFSVEEDCMFWKVCSAAGANRDAHERFVRKVGEFKARLAAEGISEQDIKELHAFLEAWVKGHIMALDTKLQDCPPGK